MLFTSHNSLDYRSACRISTGSQLPVDAPLASWTEVLKLTEDGVTAAMGGALLTVRRFGWGDAPRVAW